MDVVPVVVIPVIQHQVGIEEAGEAEAARLTLSSSGCFEKAILRSHSLSSLAIGSMSFLKMVRSVVDNRFRNR